MKQLLFERYLFLIIKKFNYLPVVSNKLLLQQIQLKCLACKRKLHTQSRSTPPLKLKKSI